MDEYYLTLCMLDNFLSSADIFLHYFFSNFSFKNNIRMSNSLDPDQDRNSVCPDLGPVFCKGYQQMTKATTSKERVKSATHYLHHEEREILKPRMVAPINKKESRFYLFVQGTKIFQNCTCPAG